MANDQNPIANKGIKGYQFWLIRGWSIIKLIVICSLAVNWAQAREIDNIWCLTFALAITFFLQSLVRFARQTGLIKTDLHVQKFTSLFIQIFIYPVLCTIVLFFVARMFIEEKPPALMYTGIALYILGLFLTLATFTLKLNKELKLKKELERVEQAPKNPLIVAQTLSKLATLYFKQRKFDQAEPLYKRALAIYENNPESDTNYFSVALDCLATIYIKQHKFDQAEILLQRVITLNEPLKEKNISLFAQRQGTLAGVYGMQKKYTESESLYKLALAMFETDPKQNKPKFAQCLKGYSNTLKGMNRFDEAKEYLARANAIN